MDVIIISVKMCVKIVFVRKSLFFQNWLTRFDFKNFKSSLCSLASVVIIDQFNVKFQ